MQPIVSKNVREEMLVGRGNIFYQTTETAGKRAGKLWAYMRMTCISKSLFPIFFYVSDLIKYITSPYKPYLTNSKVTQKGYQGDERSRKSAS